jgi:hypothetical protein
MFLLITKYVYATIMTLTCRKFSQVNNYFFPNNKKLNDNPNNNFDYDCENIPGPEIVIK